MDRRVGRVGDREEESQCRPDWKTRGKQMERKKALTRRVRDYEGEISLALGNRDDSPHQHHPALDGFEVEPILRKQLQSNRYVSVTHQY